MPPQRSSQVVAVLIKEAFSQIELKVRQARCGRLSRRTKLVPVEGLGANEKTTGMGLRPAKQSTENLMQLRQGELAGY
jgi:hypothetical protein